MTTTKSAFLRDMDEIPLALSGYCRSLNWDPKKLQTALYEIGVSDAHMYIEHPNTILLRRLSEYLTVSGSAFFIVYGENGMGKSAIKEFALRVFVGDSRFSHFSIDNPGPLTTFQIVTTILRGVSPDPDALPPHTMGAVLTNIERDLISTRESGVLTVLWIDEAQKLSLEKLAIIRSIADIKTQEGDLVCKVILVGTLHLIDRIESWMTTHPEEAGAFDDRSGFNSFSLSPWSPQHISDWWARLAEFVSIDPTQVTSPFTIEDAELVHRVSKGRPRSLVQLTQRIIATKATKIFKNGVTDESGRQLPLTISHTDIADTFTTLIDKSETKRRHHS